MPRILRIPEAASLGLHAAVLLAEEADRRLSTRELAARLDASEAHLAKVMQRLVRAGLVNSTRGPGGGFMLDQPADGISLLAVYEAIEGPVEATTCLFGTPVCDRDQCIFGGYLEEFDTHFRHYLAQATLGGLATREETADVHP
jgi:Rrf2 family protein